MHLTVIVDVDHTDDRLRLVVAGEQRFDATAEIGPKTL